MCSQCNRVWICIRHDSVVLLNFFSGFPGNSSDKVFTSSAYSLFLHIPILTKSFMQNVTSRSDPRLHFKYRPHSSNVAKTKDNFLYMANLVVFARTLYTAGVCLGPKRGLSEVLRQTHASAGWALAYMRQQRNRPSPLYYWHTLATLWMMTGSSDWNVMQLQWCCSWGLNSAALLSTFREEWIRQPHRDAILKSRSLAAANDNSGREAEKENDVCILILQKNFDLWHICCNARFS